MTGFATIDSAVEAIKLGASDYLTKPFDKVERDHILDTLGRAGGNKAAAARMLGLSRRALCRRLQQYNLPSTVSSAKKKASPSL